MSCVLRASSWPERQDHKTVAEVIEWLSKADAFGQDVFKDIVRQIQLAEPHFDEKHIESWIKTGKVSEVHAKELFRKILVES